MGQNLTFSSYSRSIPARTYGAQKKDDSGNASRIGLALKKWSGLQTKKSISYYITVSYRSTDYARMCLLVMRDEDRGDGQA